MSQPISNPIGLGEYTDLPTLCVPIVRDFEAGGTITAKDVVWLTSTLTVVECATDSAAVKAIGIAVTGGSSGDIVQVVVWGPVEDVPISGTIADAAILKPSATTAGRLASSATPAIGEALAFAIGAGSGANGTIDCFVWKGAGAA